MNIVVHKVQRSLETTFSVRDIFTDTWGRAISLTLIVPNYRYFYEMINCYSAIIYVYIVTVKSTLKCSNKCTGVIK